METELWDGPAPGSADWTHDEQVLPDDALFAPGGIRNVVVPTLTAHLPAEPTRAAVLVCPGGGFLAVSVENEGRAVARRLVDAGVAAFILKYRLLPTPADEEGFHRAIGELFAAGFEETIADHLPLAVADGARALELVRARGFEHVTLLGFSAGARLGAELVLGDPEQPGPDAAGLVYLPSVRRDGPPPRPTPLFLLAAADDPLGIAGSLDLHAAWRDAGAPVELHLFERGGHGFGTDPTGLPVDRWPELFLAWHATHVG